VTTGELLVTPRELLASTGEFGRFAGNVMRDVWGLRVFRFFGEALRQSGILIVSSTLIIWSLMFVLGLECGIEGAYFTRGSGHDKHGLYTEDAEEYQEVLDRLARKFATAINAVPGPEIRRVPVGAQRL